MRNSVVKANLVLNNTNPENEQVSDVANLTQLSSFADSESLLDTACLPEKESEPTQLSNVSGEISRSIKVATKITAPINTQTEQQSDNENKTHNLETLPELIKPLEPKILVLNNNLKSYRQLELEFNSELEKKDQRFLLPRLLAKRGFDSIEAMEKFLFPTWEDRPDPRELKDFDKVLELINHTVKYRKKILICCDFDVDGMTGGAQLYEFFREMNVYAEVKMPSRFKDGYGLNKNIVDYAKRNDFGLITAVDFGSTNLAEIEYAKKLGISVIVIDHHFLAAEYPIASAFVNPRRTDCGFANKVLCASGLVWTIIDGLQRESKFAKNIDIMKYLDLAALGTHCDMVPNIEANRILGLFGLRELEKRRRPGIRKLLSLLKRPEQLCGDDLGFYIGPCLNAVGRMSDRTQEVIQFLATKDLKIANKFASEFLHINDQRKTAQKTGLNLALEYLAKKNKEPFPAMVFDKNLHPGVVGLIAQQLSGFYNCPSMVFTWDELNQNWRGSGRVGREGAHLLDLLLATKVDFIKIGGHEAAAGVSLSENDRAQFEIEFSKVVKKTLVTGGIPGKLECDLSISIDKVNEDTWAQFRNIEPCGMKNPTPVFFIADVEVQNISKISSGHLAFEICKGKRKAQARFWNRTSHPLIENGTKINLAGKLNISSFQGKREMQIFVEAIEKAS